MASLLCTLTRTRIKPNAQLVCLVSPSIPTNVVHVRGASVHSKAQKKTISKYSARQAVAGKSANDFLSTAKIQAKGDKKKGGKDAKKTAEVASDTPKEKLGEPKVESDEGLEGEPSQHLDAYFDVDFTAATNRYEEYEDAVPAKDQEEVTATILGKEREELIKRLWEPYQTDKFNLKTLLGDAPPSSQVQGPDIVLQGDRPSKFLYYTEAELQKYLPEGVAGRVTKEFSTFTKKGVLVRPMVEDVVEWLAEWRRKQFIGRSKDKDYYTLLNGPIGCVVFIPNGRDWASRGGLSYSKVNGTWFGQPELATKWIGGLLAAHGDKLATIPLRTDFKVEDVDPDKSTFTSTPQETMKSLLEYGMQHPEQASDCVWYFRQELCSVHEFPVLVVVDAVNIIRDHTVYGDPIDPYIFAPNLDSSRLVLSRAFQEFRNHGLSNGLYVGTLSKSASLLPMQKKRANPDLLRTRYDLDSKLNIVNVPSLSRAEAHLLSDWYRENEVYANDVPSQTVDYMWAMAQGNGDIFWKQAGPM